MVLDIQKEIINYLAWLGFILLVMIAHNYFISAIFTSYGIRYVIGNVIGVTFGIIAGRYLLAWYKQK